jgi:sugar phosphate permease
MNMCGNLGGVLASIAVGYMVKSFNWQVPFLVAGALCLLGALLFLRIDPSERIFRDRSSDERAAVAA